MSKPFRKPPRSFNKSREWQPLQRAVLREDAMYTQLIRNRPELEESVWLNNLYQVFVRYLPEDKHYGQVWELSIKRLDREPIFDWRDIQRVKTEICGPECEMIQLFPAESRVVDSANSYYFFAFLTYKFPFGFKDRYLTEQTLGKSKQRPFAPEHRELNPDIGARDEEMREVLKRIRKK